jgi:hypothetical protein
MIQCSESIVCQSLTHMHGMDESEQNTANNLHQSKMLFFYKIKQQITKFKEISPNLMKFNELSQNLMRFLKI